jgi:hypothetical protein
MSTEHQSKTPRLKIVSTNSQNTGAPQSVVAKPPSTSTTKAALKQSLVWLHEMPGIVRGLIILGWPFKWHMASVFAINFAIAVWETSVAFVTAEAVMALGPESLKQPFFVIAMGIAFPILVYKLSSEILIPLMRDLYANKCLWPKMERALILRGIPAGDARREHLELRGNTAPVSQGGRLAAYGLLGSLLRDPAYILRGLGVLVYLYFCVSPWLVLLLVGGMIVDLCITLRMDAHCTPLYTDQKDRQLKVNALEYQLHEPLSSKRTSEERWQEKVGRNRITKESLAYAEATWNAEFWRILYQGVRAIISNAVQIGIMVLVAYWVWSGEFTLAAFLIFIQYSTRACEPLTTFLMLQSSIMSNRELLRRLGLLTNVDFGIKAPK